MCRLCTLFHDRSGLVGHDVQVSVRETEGELGD